MNPSDPLERVRDSFARQPMMATLGAELVHVARGAVHIAIDNAAGVRQQHGFIHGGALITIADSAAGYAAMSTVPPGTEVLTIECKTNFLRPARGRVVAEGRVIRPGRSVIVAAADVFAEADRAHVATALVTIAAVGRAP